MTDINKTSLWLEKLSNSITLSEAEFMNVQFVEISGHNFETSQTSGSVYNDFSTNKFQITLVQGGGGESGSRGDCK